ncbi:MAG: potassium channel protein [Chloroflexi bacterium]|nr:potassium channel protein [Chloroflexota bacterium]
MAEPRGTPTDHVVVCGLDHLGLRTIEELRLGDETVVGIGSAESVVEAGERLVGVTLVAGDPRREAVLRAASVQSAVAIVLTGDDDLANVHAALAAQDLNPAIRIVLRMFDPELGNHIEALFPNAVALSSSALAAPGFVSAALDGDGGATFMLAGHRVSTRLQTGDVEGRQDAPRADGGDHLTTISIATLHADRTVDLLPARAPDGAAGNGPAGNETEDSLVVDVSSAWTPSIQRTRTVLDQALETTGGVVAGVGGGIRALPSRLRGGLTRPPRIRAERRLVRFGAVLLGLAIVSAAYFEIMAGLGPLDAFSYAITLLTGAAIPNSLDPARAGAALKIYAIVLSIVGAAVVAVVYALITDAIVRSRLLQTLGRRSVPGTIADHVIVVGLGSIGHRVALDVAARGVPVVVADIDEDSRFAASTRASGIAVVTGDARHPEILADLGIERARAVIAATSDDLVNIAVALNARAVRPDLRVVVRVFDPDFAVRVQRGFGIRYTRSVSHLAAPAFAAAAIGSEVIATVPVGDRRVMLFARVPVRSGSDLEGLLVSELDEPGVRRILAIDGPGDGDARWLPVAGDAAASGDELIVAATRAGLARLLERGKPRADASTSPEPATRP